MELVASTGQYTLGKASSPLMTPSDATIAAMLRARRYLVPAVRLLLPHLPERHSRAVLAKVLTRCPQLWGWSSKSDRRSATRRSYERAFPHDHSGSFIAEAVSTRAHALATSAVYMARAQAGLGSGLLEPLVLSSADEMPCVVTYLHYAIDPAVQIALLASNRRHLFRWVVFPTQPGEPLRWGGERERALFLGGAAIPEWISETLLSVTEPSWPIDALSHIRHGGSILIALDAPLGSSRSPIASLKVGQATMPISPAIDLLARAGGARLLFVWPECRSDGSWALRCAHFANTTALAAAASRWIDGHRVIWGGWPYLTWRLKATELRRIVADDDARM
jgi:hypothetical protein